MTRKFGLIIGNSEYEDANLARLVTPDTDVNDLAKVLRDPRIGTFDEVTTLVNEISTSVQRAIAHFFSGKSPRDLLLLYFSGHGVLDEQGRLYLAVKDTERNLPYGTSVPAAFITDLMNQSNSKRQVLILDCCYSGAFARGTKGAPGATVGTAATFEGTGYGRVVLTATDSTQYAWEGNEVKGHAEKSVFTHYLIEGLATGEADIDGNGWISVDELYDYLFEHVVNDTPKQTPGKWSYKQQGEILIAKNLCKVIKPAKLPGELQQAIENPLSEVRLGAVRVLEGLLHGVHKDLALAAIAALRQLVEDDSRQVSIAANEILTSYPEATEVEEFASRKGPTGIEGSITIDQHGFIQKFDLAAEGIFGYTTDEVVGKNVKILMPLPYRDEHDGYLANYRQTGEKRIIGLRREVVGKHKDGTTFPMDIAVSEIHTGNRWVFTAVMQDITTRKHAEAVLKETVEAARRATERPEPDVEAEGRCADELESQEAGEEKIIAPAESMVADNVAIDAPPPDTGQTVESRPLLNGEVWETSLSGKPRLAYFLNFLFRRKLSLAAILGLIATVIIIWMQISVKQELQVKEAVEESIPPLQETLQTVKEVPAQAEAKQGDYDALAARENAVRAKNVASKNGAEDVQTYHKGLITLTKGDQELEQGKYREARSAFTMAERNFKAAVKEVLALKTATEKSKRLVAEAKAAEENAIKARGMAARNDVRDYAEEAYDYASRKESEGHQYGAQEKYSEAIASYQEAAQGYERGFYEKNAVEKAEHLYERGDYEKSLEVLKDVFLNVPYKGENNRALQLIPKAQRALSFREEMLSTAQKAANDGELKAALEILKRLPERDGHWVNSLAKEILAMDRTPPEILHTPKREYDPKKPIAIRATVLDNVKVKQVQLHYMKKGEEQYWKVEMNSAKGEEYRIEIPRDFHGGREIRYYFLATDLNGNERTWPANKDKLFKIRRKAPEHTTIRPP